MNKKPFLLGIVLLSAGQLFAQEMQFATQHNASGVITDYQALTNKQKIVFDTPGTMTVELKDESSIENVHSVIFRSSGVTGIETLLAQSSIAVYPNPASTSITVSGVSENARINLFNLNGALLQSSTETMMDVSALKQGVYILQADGQIVKFIKK